MLLDDLVTMSELGTATGVFWSVKGMGGHAGVIPSALGRDEVTSDSMSARSGDGGGREVDNPPCPRRNTEAIHPRPGRPRAACAGCNRLSKKTILRPRRVSGCERPHPECIPPRAGRGRARTPGFSQHRDTAQVNQAEAKSTDPASDDGQPVILID